MLRGCVVGALACQKDSYLRTIDAEVVSCVKGSASSQAKRIQSSKKSGAEGAQNATTPLGSTKFWQVEFSDSILFPEGGGQPTDHGLVVPLENVGAMNAIDVKEVQRDGLRCVYNLSKPLEPGTRVRQEVDFGRRWDYMQQHTGQHLLSAIMDQYDNLQTLGWGMGSGDSFNYVDLPRKPSEEETQKIQDECNQAIRDNLAIQVDYSNNARLDKLPDDYDADAGAVRVVKIGDLDQNTCCGTHLRQTSHIGLILLGSTQSTHSTNCRLSFTAGDRAIKTATSSIGTLRSVARAVSSNTTGSEILASIGKIKDNAADLRKRETKLVQEVAQRCADDVQTALQEGRTAYVHRADQGIDFINKVIAIAFKDAAKDGEGQFKGTLVGMTGEEKTTGQIVIAGNGQEVNDLAAKIQETGIQIKGGGRGGRWQGKVIQWQKGELDVLKRLVSA